MRKVSIISSDFDLNRFEEVLQRCDEVFNKTYHYEVVFITTTSDYKNFSSSHNVKFVKVANNMTYNEKITCGILHSEGACTMIVDFNRENWDDYVVSMLYEWENGANIVNFKNLQKDSSFFGKLNYKIRDKFLGMFNYEADKHNFRTFELYSKDVLEIMKVEPEKIPYLRASHKWLDYKEVTLRVDKKIKTKITWAKKDYNFWLGVSLLAIFVIFASLMFGLMGSVMTPINYKTYMLTSVGGSVFFLVFGTIFFVIAYLQNKYLCTNYRSMECDERLAGNPQIDADLLKEYPQRVTTQKFTVGNELETTHIDFDGSSKNQDLIYKNQNQVKSDLTWDYLDEVLKKEGLYTEPEPEQEEVQQQEVETQQQETQQEVEQVAETQPETVAETTAQPEQVAIVEEKQEETVEQVAEQAQEVEQTEPVKQETKQTLEEQSQTEEQPQEEKVEEKVEEEKKPEPVKREKMRIWGLNRNKNGKLSRKEEPAEVQEPEKEEPKEVEKEEQPSATIQETVVEETQKEELKQETPIEQQETKAEEPVAESNETVEQTEPVEQVESKSKDNVVVEQTEPQTIEQTVEEPQEEPKQEKVETILESEQPKENVAINIETNQQEGKTLEQEQPLEQTAENSEQVVEEKVEEKTTKKTKGKTPKAPQVDMRNVEVSEDEIAEYIKEFGDFDRSEYVLIHLKDGKTKLKRRPRDKSEKKLTTKAFNQILDHEDKAKQEDEEVKEMGLDVSKFEEEDTSVKDEIFANIEKRKAKSAERRKARLSGLKVAPTGIKDRIAKIKEEERKKAEREKARAKAKAEREKLKAKEKAKEKAEKEKLKAKEKAKADKEKEKAKEKAKTQTKK